VVVAELVADLSSGREQPVFRQSVAIVIFSVRTGWRGRTLGVRSRTVAAPASRPWPLRLERPRFALRRPRSDWRGRRAGAQAGPCGMRLPVPLFLQQQHEADQEDDVDAGKLP
jgi:hypothetical protein